jgi:hypothetical protein
MAISSWRRQCGDGRIRPSSRAKQGARPQTTRCPKSHLNTLLGRIARGWSRPSRPAQKPKHLARGFGPNAPLSSPTLQNQTSLLKPQPRTTRKKLTPISIPQITKEIHLPLPIRKKLGVHLASVESRHRPTIKPQSARRENKVSPFERPVPESRRFDKPRITQEHRTHIFMRKELRKLLVELRIPGDDHGDRSSHGFFDIGRRKRRTETLFCFRRSQKDKAPRCGISASRTEAGKFISLTQQLRRNRFRKPYIMRPRLPEHFVNAVVGYGCPL